MNDEYADLPLIQHIECELLTDDFPRLISRDAIRGEAKLKGEVNEQ
jgi:hypothetical protein